MEPLKKIDSVFFFIKSKEEFAASYSKKYVWNLFVERTPELGINSLMYEEIITKLVEDGYIREVKDLENPNNGNEVLHVTFKGLIFEGYFKEDRHTKSLQRQTQRNSRLIGFLTTIVAFGTLVSAIYYFNEILKYVDTLERYRLLFSSIITVVLLIMFILMFRMFRKAYREDL